MSTAETNIHPWYANRVCPLRQMILALLMPLGWYIMLRKKVYPLFPSEYSICRSSWTPDSLEGQPIRVPQLTYKPCFYMT